MKKIFNPGDKKIYKKVVEESDTAAFQGRQVHPVCATFALARDIEWASRLFVLDMKEEDEEGIGTELMISHCAPAFIGEELLITATLTSLEGNSVTCSYTVQAGGRRVAEGITGQKVLKKERLADIFNQMKNGKEG